MSLPGLLRFVASHPLNAEHPVQAILGFARWQMASRLINQEFIFDWVNGAKFRVRRGQTGITGNIYTGLHEFADMAFLLHYLRAEDLFADVGANVGSYTILACSSIGARCVTVEPVPATFEHLVENVRLNRSEDRARCLNLGIGGSAGSIRFTSDRDTVNHVASDAEPGINVQVQTLDQVMQEETPRLVKIDVEGYEAPVIDGAAHTLGGKGPQAVIMELNGSGRRYGFDEDKTVQRMLDWGFRPYSYDPFKRNLQELPGKNHGANTIFLRDVDFALQRVHSASAFFVRGRNI